MGHLIAGISLDIIEFPSNAVPGEVDSEIVFQLGIIYGPIAMVPAFISAFFYAKYKINRQRLTEIQAILADRKAATTATGVSHTGTLADEIDLEYQAD